LRAAAISPVPFEVPTAQVCGQTLGSRCPCRNLAVHNDYNDLDFKTRPTEKLRTPHGFLEISALGSFVAHATPARQPLWRAFSFAARSIANRNKVLRCDAVDGAAKKSEFSRHFND
jgi:hypothetical protein